ncbi:uncharacterized protein LACBIDRAFT_334945 [Laccaria bicolor S238N-H82]|uniref:Predicted protein n=1 Tax=Laccaria bicolor (strain S238N-H82 / ATCC MYA-4686) TaxID=486041 RepID=B0E0V3_LACBS|nr:uncharacterized protein LACBIDRAFT_334945 [Laccaria bicolor S238N-H82]EDQ99465.1 predicted protein [Laccaria bicolor S238N-H82]|eukprot:XP_001889814.1 predicted protein [Laccaria bicolor S238N-H82]
MSVLYISIGRNQLMIRQKGTRVWYNMSSGGLMFATVDSTGRLPDGTILLTIIDDDGERVTLPYVLFTLSKPPFKPPHRAAECGCLSQTRSNMASWEVMDPVLYISIGRNQLMIRQKGTRVWYNMSSGGLMFATVDSTGRLPDGTILLTIIDDDGERVTLPYVLFTLSKPPFKPPHRAAECGCLSQTRSNMASWEVMDPVNCMTEYWTMTGKEKPR